jgi:hypothetical protein
MDTITEQESVGEETPVEATLAEESGATEAPQEIPEVSAEVEASEAQEQETAKGNIEQYVPNLKYKVKDEEFEFDERAKKFITDKETEEYFRELMTKGHGIDEIKKARDDFKGKYEDIHPKYEAIENSLQTLSQMVQNGDMDGFFSALKIPEQAVLKYAVDRLKYSQMAPEERARIDAERQQREQYQTMEQQNATLQQQVEQQQVAQRNMELDMALSRQDIQPLAQQFDAQVGQPGAFRSKIVEKGLAHYYSTGEDVTAQKALELTLAEIQPFLGAGAGGQQTVNAGAAGAAVPPATTAPGQVAVQNKPVIPNIKSAGGSPVKKQPKSLDDLKRIRSQMIG